MDTWNNFKIWFPSEANFVWSVSFITCVIVSNPGRVPQASLGSCISCPKIILSMPTCCACWTAWCGRKICHFAELDRMWSNGPLCQVTTCVCLGMTRASSWTYLLTYHHDTLKISKLRWSKLQPHIQAAERPCYNCFTSHAWTLRFSKGANLQISRRIDITKTVPFSLWLFLCEVRNTWAKFRLEAT